MKKLHEFDSLEEAQAEALVETKLMSGDQMRIHMVMNGLYGYFKNHTADPQMAAYDNLTGGEFNFIDGHTSNITPLYLAMIDGETNEATKEALTSLLSECQGYCNQVTYPYADADSVSYLAAVDAYSEPTVVDLAWSGEKSLKITLHNTLYEPTNAVLFYSNDVFTNENVGRPKRLDKAGTYGIDLTGVTKKGTLHINFGIQANATCELV